MKRTGKGTTFPTTLRVRQIDDFYGTKVRDPYRWLEGPGAWIDAQNEFSTQFLAGCPATPVLAAYMKAKQPPEKEEKQPIEQKYGDRIFYWARNADGKGVHWCKDNALAEPRIVLDVESEDGTVSVAGMRISPNGRYIVYGLSKNGSHRPHVKIRDVDSGKDLPETLIWIPLGAEWQWKADESGFFYTRYVGSAAGESDDQGYSNGYKICFHVPGTDQESDAVWYERPQEPACGMEVEVLTDRFMLINMDVGTTHKTGYLVKDLSIEGSPYVELVKHSRARFELVAHEGSVYWFFTDLEAPRGRVVAIDVDVKPGSKPVMHEVIGQSDALLTSVARNEDGRFFAVYTKDVISIMKEFNADGSLRRDLDVPGVGTIYQAPQKNKNSGRLEYGYADMLTSYDSYSFDPETGRSTLIPDPSARCLDKSRFVSRQVFYPSKDGTLVPMFLCHRADIKLDGKNPVWMTVYGGFGESVRPSLTPELAAWFEMGGILAQPCVRGGGEYGEPWHQAATKLHKQVTVDDVIAAVEWLIANRYTRKRKIALSGTSNGAFIVAACVVQRRDLFGAVIMNSGLMDMMRYDRSSAAKHWRPEFGSATASEAEFEALFALAPYNNVRFGVYPAALILVGDGDDIVVPWHSYKFAAALQHAQTGDAPILLQVEHNAGHGAHKVGKGKDWWIDGIALRMGFLVKALKIEDSRWQKLSV